MAHPNASLKTLTLIFVGIYILFTVAMFALLFALEMFFQFSLDSNVMGAIIPCVSAMQVGTIYFNRTDERPSRKFAWKAGFSFSLTSTLLAVALFAAAYAAGLFPEMEDLMREPSMISVLAAFLVGVLLLMTVLCRFSFGTGAWQGQKRKEALQARG